MKKKPYNFRLPPVLMGKLKKIADKEGITLTDQLTVCIRSYIFRKKAMQDMIKAIAAFKGLKFATGGLIGP